MASLDYFENNEILNSEVSLIQEEDSKDVTTIYDSNGLENDVIKYDLEVQFVSGSVNSPMQFKPLNLGKLAAEEDLQSVYSNFTNSRLTSANSQFSDSHQSNRNSSYGFSGSEAAEYEKNIDIPKLRSPFSLSSAAAKECENMNGNTGGNSVSNNVQKKKRNRSLRWSYQGEIETINEIQKQKALQDTETKLCADAPESVDVEVPLRKLHKRTTSMPYAKPVKNEANSSGEHSRGSMISLKRRLSPSTFFKTQDERELKIKNQQEKIKNLELENLKQFSHIQELKFQTSYCIKEIEILKKQKVAAPNNTVPMKVSKFHKLTKQIFKIIVLLSLTFLLVLHFYPNILLETNLFQKHVVPNYLDFAPDAEKLWYSIKQESQVLENNSHSLWEKIKLQVHLIKQVNRNSRIYQS